MYVIIYRLKYVGMYRLKYIGSKYRLNLKYVIMYRYDNTDVIVW